MDLLSFCSFTSFQCDALCVRDVRFQSGIPYRGLPTFSRNPGGSSNSFGALMLTYFPSRCVIECMIGFFLYCVG